MNSNKDINDTNNTWQIDTYCMFKFSSLLNVIQILFACADKYNPNTVSAERMQQFVGSCLWAEEERRGEQVWQRCLMRGVVQGGWMNGMSPGLSE